MHSSLASTISGVCKTHLPHVLQELAAQTANDFAGKPQATQRRMMNAFRDKTSEMSQDPEQKHAFGFGIALYILVAPKAELEELLGLAKVHHLDPGQALVISTHVMRVMKHVNALLGTIHMHSEPRKAARALPFLVLHVISCFGQPVPVQTLLLLASMPGCMCALYIWSMHDW